MRSFELRVEDKAYQVEIGDLTESPIEVTVNGQRYRVEVLKKDTVPAVGAPEQIAPAPSPVAAAPPTPQRAAPESQPIPTEGTPVTAPMPGKILSVQVAVGDHVEAGDVLCTLEAMKMEMAIKSTATGTVTQVSVSTGQTVSHGDILCIVA